MEESKHVKELFWIVKQTDEYKERIDKQIDRAMDNFKREMIDIFDVCVTNKDFNKIFMLLLDMEDFELYKYDNLYLIENLIDYSVSCYSGRTEEHVKQSHLLLKFIINRYDDKFDDEDRYKIKESFRLYLNDLDKKDEIEIRRILSLKDIFSEMFDCDKIIIDLIKSWVGYPMRPNKVKKIKKYIEIFDINYKLNI